jgi:hypothetical protein
MGTFFAAKPQKTGLFEGSARVLCRRPQLHGKTKRSGCIRHICSCGKENGGVFTDLENIVIIELPKVPRTDDGSKVWPVPESETGREDA